MSTFRTTPEHFGATRWLSLGSARQLAAWSLMGASAVLARLAERLLLSASQASPGPFCVEFHPEADGRYGALYINGVWVGRIPGVTRL